MDKDMYKLVLLWEYRTVELVLAHQKITCSQQDLRKKLLRITCNHMQSHDLT